MEETLAASRARHGGRPLDPTRDGAICQAALDLLAEVGYDRLTVEAVAARAGAGKATVYRRWSSKAALVADALNQIAPPPLLPDTGSLKGDCEVLTDILSQAMDQSQIQVTQGLTSALCRDAALMDVFHKEFMEPRRQALAELLRRGVDRGEIPPGKDLELLISLVPSVMFYRKMVTGAPADRAWARRFVEQVFLPAAIAPLPAN